jgi:hypothetical protein
MLGASVPPGCVADEQQVEEAEVSDLSMSGHQHG